MASKYIGMSEFPAESSLGQFRVKEIAKFSVASFDMRDVQQREIENGFAVFLFVTRSQSARNAKLIPFYYFFI